MFQTVPIPPPDEPPEDSGPDKVVLYREEVLRKAGYSAVGAILLSEEPRVDLHRAVDLIEKGCDPTLALRILL